ncbi:hypothetical protein [Acinetobacter soli]|uniref:hypothetical protein n=1 Tax=Acinetobacter soli TaxID=487316 RepID=UPI00300CFD5B
MLIIYGSFNIGGIETFFLRLAKERFLNKQKIKIIFTIPKDQAEYNSDLLEEVNKYAEIYYFEDIFCNIFLSWRFHLFHKLNIEKLKKIMVDIDHIHVCDSYSGILAYKFLNEIEMIKPVTFGVYHTMEFTWGDRTKLPYFEKVNRKLVFEINSSSNLICFSKDTKKILEEKVGKNLEDAQTFRLGVIEDNEVLNKKININNQIKICAVGRLANFKTYNLWMPKVINNLRSKGFNVDLDIYGSGEKEFLVKAKIREYSNQVRLLPAFSYSQFNEIVSKYDMFIGSGTAIIQASSLGLPSIIGIESIEEPETYGFFCDFYEHEYNVKGLPFELLSVESLIENFLCSSFNEQKVIVKKHVDASKNFKISTCSNNFNSMRKKSIGNLFFNKYFYTLSKLLFNLKLKILKKTIYD